MQAHYYHPDQEVADDEAKILFIRVEAPSSSIYQWNLPKVVSRPAGCAIPWIRKIMDGNPTVKIEIEPLSMFGTSNSLKF